MSWLRRCFLLLVLTGCAAHRPRPVTIFAPEDSVPARYMAHSADYVCRLALLYDISGPKVEACQRTSGDTTWVVDRENTTGRVLAAGWEAMVPIDHLADATDALEDALTHAYGAPDSCVTRAQTLRRWWWWPVGRYTVQVRMVDPSPIFAVHRGRLEVQALPAEAVTCLDWVHPAKTSLVP
jgi:hypothetical protein